MPRARQRLAGTTVLSQAARRKLGNGNQKLGINTFLVFSVDSDLHEHSFSDASQICPLGWVTISVALESFASDGVWVFEGTSSLRFPRGLCFELVSIAFAILVHLHRREISGIIVRGYIMAPAVADVEGPGFSIREMRVEDVHDAGEVYYRAFYVDSLASGIPPAFNAPSAEAGRSLIAAMVAYPSYYKLAAFDSEGKVIGIACIDMGDSYANGVGPVAVSPDSSNRGVGKSLMKAIVEQAQKRKSPSIRLNTSGSNRKSFCLYASLGFRPVECTTSFFGTVEPDAGMQAASSVGISLDGISSRKMEEADVKACGEIFSKGMGYGRENDIRAMLARWPEGCYVATTNDDTIVGYTTGLFLLGHAMASSEAAWVAAISAAIQAKAGVVACVTIPGVYYPRLINWALAAKLVLARHNWYMVVGDYQKPKDGFFWSPSIQH